MKVSLLLPFAAALVVAAGPVTAADWRYFGTYPSQEGKWYMSFYDPDSVHKGSATTVTALVFVQRYTISSLQQRCLNPFGSGLAFVPANATKPMVNLSPS